MDRDWQVSAICELHLVLPELLHGSGIVRVRLTDQVCAAADDALNETRLSDLTIAKDDDVMLEVSLESLVEGSLSLIFHHCGPVVLINDEAVLVDDGSLRRTTCRAESAFNWFAGSIVHS